MQHRLHGDTYLEQLQLLQHDHIQRGAWHAPPRDVSQRRDPCDLETGQWTGGFALTFCSPPRALVILLTQ